MKYAKVHEQGLYIGPSVMAGHPKGVPSNLCFRIYVGATHLLATMHHEVPFILAVILIGLGVLLLLHHGYKHMDDDPEALVMRESCSAVCFFQRSDISNHETWILVCWTNALTLILVSLFLKA